MAPTKKSFLQAFSQWAEHPFTGDAFAMTSHHQGPAALGLSVTALKAHSGLAQGLSNMGIHQIYFHTFDSPFCILTQDRLIRVFQPSKKLETKLEKCSDEKRKSRMTTDNVCYRSRILALSYESSSYSFPTTDENQLFLTFHQRRSVSEWTKPEPSVAVTHRNNSYFKQYLWSLFLCLLSS